MSDRIFRVLLGCGLLAAGLYLPAYSLATTFVNPIVIQANRPPLSAGDVLLVRNSAHARSALQVGDLVQYQIADTSVRGQAPGGGAAMILFRGSRLDRVLAGPGQVVVWDGARLTVDGQLSPVLPLNPSGVRQSLNFTVPADNWFILPSTEIENSQIQPTEVILQSLSTVSTQQIEGRVIWRSWPWTRIGFVH